MASEKSRAIVLRVIDFSETSCIVSLFTEGLGKISAMAKGARRPKSPFESALDLLARCRIVFLHKSSDSLDLLTEAKLDRRFRAAARDLSRLYAGYYVAELLQELTDEADPHPILFSLADRTLDGLDNDGPVAELVLRFEMMALKILGHMPSLDACAGCGGPVNMQQKIPFSQIAGGVLCGECRRRTRGVVLTRPEVIELLKRYADDGQAWQQERLDNRWRGEMRGVLNHYLTNQLGRRPRMHKYLGMMMQ